MNHQNQSGNDAHSASPKIDGVDMTARALWRASDDVLKRRTIFKATKLSPQKGVQRASEDVIKQRKIVKVNKSSVGSPPAGYSSPVTHFSTPHKSSTSHYFSPTQPSVSCSTPTRTMAAEEEIHPTMRAKLFKRCGSAWVKMGAGTLQCNCIAGKRRIKLHKNEIIFLDVDVEQMLHLTKLNKESSKEKMCAYIRFLLGHELYLIQVKPELIGLLFSTLTEEVST
ncbi:hypothetical protein ACHAW5_004688 [Stephanodiscus triporus]|uniref:Uncharacterized protein n=1 Tax=Stephanodiscus triporus TaxID=2934178 RepID=A0ABD3P5V1_9STRA